jgi:hypothetical protein
MKVAFQQGNIALDLRSGIHRAIGQANALAKQRETPTLAAQVFEGGCETTPLYPLYPTLVAGVRWCHAI